MLIDESHVLELRIEVSRYDSRSLFLALLKQEWEISDSFHAYIHLTKEKVPNSTPDWERGACCHSFMALNRACDTEYIASTVFLLLKDKLWRYVYCLLLTGLLDNTRLFIALAIVAHDKYNIIYKYGKRTRLLKRKITRQLKIKRELKMVRLAIMVYEPI